MTAPRLHVVAAVLQRNERYLIQQRQPGKHMAGLWEFPGGKVEAGETAWNGLTRELGEELGIEAEQGESLIRLVHSYPDRTIDLDVWRVNEWRGEPQPREQQVTAWHTLAELRDMPLLPADLPVLNAMALPHRIVVTPDWTIRTEEFLTRLTRTVKRHQLELCILRQTCLAPYEYRLLAAKANEVLKDLGCKLVLHGMSDDNVDTLNTIGAFGIHVSAVEGMAFETPPTHVANWSMSCHTSEDLHKAGLYGARFALLGSVNSLQPESGGNKLGWTGFNQLVSNANLPVYATGGMQTDDEVRSRLEGAQGVAAVSAFWDRG